ncbi:MAG: hypothetical protein LBI54_03490, partial [Lachnospiraceae bacterium]|nr:hypothetical protein [Lachnospiraceae bacterium]
MNNTYKDALQKIEVPAELLAKTQAEMAKAKEAMDSASAEDSGKTTENIPTETAGETLKAFQWRPLYSAVAAACVVVLGAALFFATRRPIEESGPAHEPPSQELALVEIPREETVALAELASELRNKYALEELYEYTTPVYNIAPDQELVFRMGIDPGEVVEVGEDIAFDNPAYDDFVKIFIDRDFSIPAYYWTRFDPETMRLTITPSSAVRNPDLFGTGYWGYANQFYAVLYYDTMTGAKLDKPRVTIFTVQAPLDAPRIEFVRNDEGIARIQWEPVEGAAEYLVYRTYGKSNSAGFPVNIAKDNTLTEYVFDGDDLRAAGSDIPLLMNLFFINPSEGDEIYVIAVNEHGEYSAASNSIRIDSFARFLPASIASEHNSENAVASTLDDIINSYTYIRMCDGSSVVYPVTFDIGSAEIVDVAEWFDLPESTVVLYLVAQVDGTILKAEYFVREWNDETLEEDLQKLYERIEKTKLGAAGAIVKPTLGAGSAKGSWTTNSDAAGSVKG